MAQNVLKKALLPLSRGLDRLGVVHPIARYMILHWALGMGVGLFCAAAMLWINPLGMRTLLFRSDAMILGLILLFVGFSTLFGGIVCATAVMYPDNDHDGAGGRRVEASARLATVERPRVANPRPF